MNCFDRSPARARLGALVVSIALSLMAHAAAGRGADEPRIHEVHRGQTLGMIARRYGVKVDAIIFANRIERRNRIRPGQLLLIPARSDPGGKRARARRDGGARAPQSSRRKAPTARSTKRKRAPRRFHRRGYVRLLGATARWEGYAVTKGDVLTRSARRGFERVLVSRRTGKQHRIDPTLIRAVVRVSDHFGGRPIHVVSGFRPKSVNRWTHHSKHSLGRAVDFRIQGVRNSTLRDYLRALGTFGVGYYPNSSFVHLDVRKRAAYWVDFSRPGERPRYALPDGSDPAERRRTAKDPASTPERPAPTR